jgi:hypothetical protein
VNSYKASAKTSAKTIKKTVQNQKEAKKMNHNKVLTRGIMLVSIAILVTGCAASQTTTSPTTAPQTCPTSETQSCPTAAAQAMPEVNAWRWGYTGGIPMNVVITFDPGDKCSMEVINPLAGSYFNPLWNQLSYDIVVNDQTYQNYVVFVYSVDPGTTQAQMDAENPDPSLGEPPSWMNIIAGDIIYPKTRTFHTSAIDITQGPLYFTCLAQGPDKLRVIGDLGPLEVPAVTP